MQYTCGKANHIAGCHDEKYNAKKIGSLSRKIRCQLSARGIRTTASAECLAQHNTTRELAETPNRNPTFGEETAGSGGQYSPAV